MSGIEMNEKLGWKDLAKEILVEKGGEIKLRLGRDRTSVRLSTDEGDSLELVPREERDWEVYLEGTSRGRITQDDFLEETIGEVNSEYRASGTQVDSEERVKGLLLEIVVVKASENS